MDATELKNQESTADDIIVEPILTEFTFAKNETTDMPEP